jgi:hypothetical protein
MRPAFWLTLCLSSVVPALGASGVLYAQVPDPGPGMCVSCRRSNCICGGGGGSDSGGGDYEGAREIGRSIRRFFDSLFEGPSEEEKEAARQREAEREREREREAAEERRIEAARERERRRVAAEEMRTEADAEYERLLREAASERIREEEARRREEAAREARADATAKDTVDAALRSSRKTSKSVRLGFVNRAGAPLKGVSGPGGGPPAPSPASGPAGDPQKVAPATDPRPGTGERVAKTTEEKLKSAAYHGSLADLYAPEGDSAADHLRRDAAQDQLRRVFDTAGKFRGSLAVDVPGRPEDPPTIPKGREQEFAPLLREMEEVRQQRAEQQKKLEELNKQPPGPDRNMAIFREREKDDKLKHKQGFLKFSMDELIKKPADVPNPSGGSKPQ